MEQPTICVIGAANLDLAMVLDLDFDLDPSRSAHLREHTVAMRADRSESYQ